MRVRSEKVDPSEFVLVTHLDNLAAAAWLGRDRIEVVSFEGDAKQARASEIELSFAGGLGRILDVADRVAEYISLQSPPPTCDKSVASATEPLERGAISEAARRLPIPGRDLPAKRKHVERLVKIAGLSRDAHLVAKSRQLDDHQSALLAAAKENDAAGQVAVLEAWAARKAGGRKGVASAAPVQFPIDTTDAQQSLFDSCSTHEPVPDAAHTPPAVREAITVVSPPSIGSTLAPEAEKKDDPWAIPTFLDRRDSNEALAAIWRAYDAAPPLTQQRFRIELAARTEQLSATS